MIAKQVNIIVYLFKLSLTTCQVTIIFGLSRHVCDGGDSQDVEGRKERKESVEASTACNCKWDQAPKANPSFDDSDDVTPCDESLPISSKVWLLMSILSVVKFSLF